jgi:hypothetical protein
MADMKHCTASPINDFEGFLHIFYCWIKNFMESLTEKLLRQVGWQGRVQNNWNSPHDVRSPDCRVLTQTYSPNFFSSRFWRFGERWFLSLLYILHYGIVALINFYLNFSGVFFIRPQNLFIMLWHSHRLHCHHLSVDRMVSMW